jgi:hypothetical protein
MARVEDVYGPAAVLGKEVEAEGVVVELSVERILRVRTACGG